MDVPGFKVCLREQRVWQRSFNKVMQCMSEWFPAVMFEFCCMYMYNLLQLYCHVCVNINIYVVILHDSCTPEGVLNKLKLEVFSLHASKQLDLV